MHEQHRNLRAVSIAPRDAATDDHNERERVEQLDKRISTLRAKAVLVGWRLDVLPDGFELSRWSRYRLFGSIDEAEAFVSEVAP